MKISFKTIRALAGLTILVGVLLSLTSCAVQVGNRDHTVSVLPDTQTITCSAFGQKISLSYETSLATSAEATTVPAVLPDDWSLFAGWHPAYTQIRFLGLPVDRVYQLPVADVENNIPQVMVFPTRDFPGNGDDHPQGFVNQVQSLTELLKTGVDSN